MGFKLQYFAIIFLVIMINSHYTFATWREPPVDHSSKGRQNCNEWLAAYSFTENDTDFNRSEAQNRHRKYDTDVLDLAALYAQLICSFHSNEQFLPSDFCDKYNYNPQGFQKITVLVRRCKDWIIRLYGFKEERIKDDNDNYIEPETLNWHRSKNRNKLEDNYINIWPALYVRFLDDVPEDKSISVHDFCNGMGQGNNRFMFKFITIETEMTCENWIYFAGYSSNIEKNLEVFHQSISFDKYINTWAQLYGDHLHVDSNNAPMPRRRGYFADLDVNQRVFKFDSNNPYWLTPFKFCCREEGNDLSPKPLYTYHHSGHV